MRARARVRVRPRLQQGRQARGLAVPRRVVEGGRALGLLRVRVSVRARDRSGANGRVRVRARG